MVREGRRGEGRRMEGRRRKEGKERVGQGQEEKEEKGVIETRRE